MIPDGSQSRIKFHLTVKEQVSLLKSRGMIIEDSEEAERILLRLGYYRLSGYFYPLRKPNPPGTSRRQDDFREGTSLELVQSVYEFDRQLRLLVLDAVERIEVAVRCDIAHRLGRRHRRAHECAAELDTKFCTEVVDPITNTTRYDEWLKKLEGAIVKAKKEEFVKHYSREYGGKMPVWVITEIWDFGLLSRFFAGMQYRDQTFIARRYGLQEGNYLVSWLRAINFVRNVSAHHSRLWNKNIVDTPRFQEAQPHHLLFHVTKEPHARTRVYGTLCVLKTMLNVVSPGNIWHERLKMVCAGFPESSLVSLDEAGFPINWLQKPLWK